MELTWIAIAASLLMGSSALLIFIWAVRYHQFRNFEDVKYQVFWSDLAEPEATEPESEKQVSAVSYQLSVTKPEEQGTGGMEKSVVNGVGEEPPVGRQAR